MVIAVELVAALKAGVEIFRMPFQCRRRHGSVKAKGYLERLKRDGKRNLWGGEDSISGESRGCDICLCERGAFVWKSIGAETLLGS